LTVAIPDEVVVREPAPTRKGRPGPAPPPPPDVLGPVLRVLVLTAAMTGLRQSELLGLRWRDVDWNVQRIRVRNAFVCGQHSTDGKSDLSTRRSVPMADRIAGELDRWSRRSSYSADEDLVFAHPETGNPLDRSKVTKRFKAACRAAGVPRSDSTISDTHLVRAWPPAGSRSARSRSSSATPTSRPPRSGSSTFWVGQAMTGPALSLPTMR
jgi:integrase